jgi:hypothetical protein
MNGAEAMNEVDGLRTAKRIVRKQTVVVKGDRSEFAKGYRRAIADLMAMIEAEIKSQPELLEPGWSIDDVMDEIPEDAPQERELSGAERLELDEVFRRHVETDEELQRLLNADLAEVKTWRWP